MSSKNQFPTGTSFVIPSTDIDPAYAMFLAEMNKIESRGPGYYGTESFDNACGFVNFMKLNFNRRMKLNSIAEELKSLAIKEYVFKMTKSSVIPKKCKMEFSQGFTKEFLLPFFINELVQVVVNCSYSNNKIYVWMILGCSGKATITSGLTEAVEEFS